MTHERIIEIIQTGMAWANWTNEQKEAMLLAMESVKRQIPKKAIKTEHSSQACPLCKSNVNYLYCSSCGQRISY